MNYIQLLVLAALLGWWMPAQAQQPPRVALLIGNANYTVGRLTNPPQDVQAMETALNKLGFKVQKVLNANQNQMKRAVRDFGNSAQGADVAFLYYSGHGTQANGENYLLPVGASIDKESDYAIEAIAANDVLQQIRGARPKAAILVLDACRDNPLAANTRSSTKGLGRMDAPTGTMIAFATAPNNVASDNGDYAKVLARELQKPGQELIDVFRNTTAEVRRLSAGKQEPRISEMSISERLYLAGQGTQLASLVPEPISAITPTGRPSQSSGLSLDDLEKEEATRKEWSQWQGKMKADYDKTAAFIGSADLRTKALERFLAAWAQDNPLSREDEALREAARQRMSALTSLGSGAIQGYSATPTPQSAVFRWRLASSFPKSIDTIFGSAESLAKRVDELTGGKFKISVHAPGELMPSFGVVDGVQNQTVEMAHTFPYYFFGKDAAWSFGSGLAFAVNGRERDAWPESDAGSVAWGQFLAKQGLRSWRLGDAIGKARDLPLTSAWWCRKPVRTLADLKGLRVRVGGHDGKVWERLGVILQNVPGGEIYTALEKGSLDCAAWISPYDDERLGFVRVAPYYVYAPGLRARAQTMLLVSEAAWATLPAPYRAALEQAVLEVAPEMGRTYLQKNDPALLRLVSQGAKLMSLESAALRAAERAAKEQWSLDASSSSEFAILWSSWIRENTR